MQFAAGSLIVASSSSFLSEATMSYRAPVSEIAFMAKAFGLTALHEDGLAPELGDDLADALDVMRNIKQRLLHRRELKLPCLHKLRRHVFHHL